MKKEAFDPKEIVALPLEPTPLKNNCAMPCPSPDPQTVVSLGYKVKIS